jgi:hypothetical protein
MKKKFLTSLLLFVVAGPAHSQSLYDVGIDPESLIPLKWSVGANLIYDTNVMPGTGPEESSLGFNPSVGANFGNQSPQTTWDIMANLGLIYYFDKSEAAGGDDINSQSRVSGSFRHRPSERLRFTNTSYLAYELEPNYAYGQATSRTLGAYFSWQTDNSVGFRWSERFGTNTGIRLNGTQYFDASDNDRFGFEFYNQFRYQFDPQTVFTTEYRVSQISSSGLASDSTNHYFTGGVERSFSQATSGVLSAGFQYRQVDEGDSESSPYLQFAINSRMTEALTVRAFTRYSMEGYDTVLTHPTAGIGLVEFDDRRTLRLGVSSDYVISPILSLFGGVDYIPTSFQGGRSVTGFTGDVPDLEDDLVNAYIGISAKFNDSIKGTFSYNYTDSASDVPERTYDRSRFSVGVQADF